MKSGLVSLSFFYGASTYERCQYREGLCLQYIVAFGGDLGFKVLAISVGDKCLGFFKVLFRNLKNWQSIDYPN